VKLALESIEGVNDCHASRIPHCGPHYFVDLHVRLDGSQTLEKAHDLTETIEKEVRVLLPDGDATVHPEPWIASEKPRPA
jgi:ferrous-iron efflux pump FieF